MLLPNRRPAKGRGALDGTLLRPGRQWKYHMMIT